MNEDLESRLRSSLRPVAPRDVFSQDLVSRVAAGARPRRSLRAMAWRPSIRSTWWLSASVAASLLLVLSVQYQMQQERARQNGLEARRQVVEALRMTSQKLNLAYETIKSESSSLADEKPGV
jgi:hypothetical protein